MSAPPPLAGVVAFRASVEENPAMDDDIRYARSGGVAIAYQVVGEGEVDLVYVPDYVSNLVYARTGITFDDRGFHELKGIPGTWQLFAAATDSAV